MDDNVVVFPGSHPFTIEEGNTKDIPVPRVYEGAIQADLRDIIIIGREKETDELYLATSSNNLGKIILFMELAKKRLLDIE